MEKQVLFAQRPRWWLLILICLLAVFAFGIVSWLEVTHRQMKVMWMMQIVFITVGLLGLWLLFFSRIAWQRRFIVLGILVVLGGAGGALVRIRGVDGDLVPILAWRWGWGSGTERLLEKQSTATATDYAQFLGPGRNARLDGVRLARDWDKPPQLLWRRQVGPAWSAFAVVGDLALTQEQDGAEEQVVCYALKTGKKLWSYGYPARYATTLAGIGPRATPTVVDGRVYTMGATGILHCLALADGRMIWQKDILADNKASLVPWGISCSPLIWQDLVVVSAGGPNGRSLVAYNKADGHFVWGGGDDTAGYASPQLVRVGGVEQILIFTRNQVAAYDPRHGNLLWHYPWPGGTECVAQPVVLPGDRLLVSSGYGIGAKVFQLVQDAQGMWSVTLVWESRSMKAKFTNMVYRDGYIYGLDDGILACVDAVSGQRQWKRGRYGHGQLLLVGDLLLIQAEMGDVVLVEANPEVHTEVGRFSALSRKTWNNPALAGSYLLVRNDQEAACYELNLE